MTDGLIEAIKAGDKSRLAELYTENRGLLYSLARRYCGIDPASDMDDLMQAGYLGLVTAVDAWDPAAYAWSTVAVPYVRNAMRKAVGIAGTRKRAHLGAVSLDAPLPGGEDGDTTRADLLADERLPDADEDLLRAEIVRTVRVAVDAIPNARQAEAVRLRQLEGMSGRRVGEALGCSRERVRQLERDGLKVLRHDRHMRELRRAYCLDQETRFHAHKGVGAFLSDWTSSTEASAMWRIERARAVYEIPATVQAGEP